MIYRKSGTVVRWENGTLVRSSESGVAVEDGDLFTCEPQGGASVPEVDPAGVVEASRRIRAAAGGLGVERLIVSEGSAVHQCEERRWEESVRRVHLSLTRGRMRVLIDLGSFDHEHVGSVASVLARAEPVEEEAPARLRLAPAVTAALLPSLAGLAPPNVTLLQSAGGLDGYGVPVLEATGNWPNWYRPSYRSRPVRTAMNLRLECDVVEIDESRPVAVALLEPVHDLTLRVLIDAGDRAFPAHVRVTRIDAVGERRIWYPYAAGSFGAEMML